MPSRSETFIRQNIAAAGVAVLDPRIAYELRPDLWASQQDCVMTFRRKQEVAGANRVIAVVAGYGPVLVAARSMDNLAQRLEWITGKQVLEIQPEPPVVNLIDPDLQRIRHHNSREVERLVALRKVADRELLGHDCSHDRETLAARRELGDDA